mgnify:CR=1 FL=1
MILKLRTIIVNKKINFVFKNTDTDSIIVSDKVIDYRIIHGPRFCSLYNTMNSLGLAKKHSEDLLPNEPFFYEYEWPWWFKIEDFFGESGFLENNSIPSNVLLRIKEKTAYLVLTIPMESCVFPHHLKIIHSYFEKVNLPHTQILYFNCSPNGNELYQQFCSSNNVDPKFISKYAPVYLNTYRHFVDSEYYQKSIDYKVEHKQKDFLIQVS